MQMLVKNWYVLYTRPKSERKVAEQLSKRKISYYVPMNEVPRDWLDRKRTAQEPLFPSYVFVSLDQVEKNRISHLEGFMSFVCWHGKPAVISDDEVTYMKQLFEEFCEVRAEKIPVNVSEPAKVSNSPLMIVENNVLGFRNSGVRVSLPSMGYSLVGEVRRENTGSINRLRMSNLYDKIKNSFIP